MTTHYKAFVLIEQLLILSIVLFFMLFSFFHLLHAREILTEKQFITRFERFFLYTQKMAILSKKDSFVLYEGSKRRFIFTNRFEQENHILPLPETITRFRMPNKLTFKGESGRNSSLNTIEFSFHHLKEKHSYRFQMGSGRYHKTVEKL